MYAARLRPKTRAAGLIAPSSGNHGIALAAQCFKVPATVVMPTTAPRFKCAMVEHLGAQVVFAGITTEDRMAMAIRIAQLTGGHIVPPYDHPAIIAGQGTCGLEIIEDRPPTGTILVPVGGGGLAAGVALAIKARARAAGREIRLIAVEPEGAAKLTRALTHGSPVFLEHAASIADGLLPLAIGTRNYAILATLADQVVTVSDVEISRAMRFLSSREQVTSEPSGAVTTAALLAGKATLSGDVVAVLSGGNISEADLHQHIAN